jgi:hypothetical protein
MWSDEARAAAPVDKADLSPDRPHKRTSLPKPLPGIIPVVHTPYDYDKGIS